MPPLEFGRRLTDCELADKRGVYCRVHMNTSSMKMVHHGLRDPLNPYQDANNNGNSIIYIKSPTIFHFLPNSKSGVVNSQQPVISAYIYPSLASGVDTSTFVIQVDANSYKVPGTAYNSLASLLSFQWPVALQNGTRQMKISVKNLAGNLVTDSTSFVGTGGRNSNTESGRLRYAKAGHHDRRRC